ncbi:MAG TPA: hypothetical protein VGP73_20765 [Thermoanaerobaculia bacterium]
MRTSTPRTLLTVLLLALLLAPEALLLHRCACGRVFDCCCRKQLKTGDSCPLHPAMAHCAGSSQGTPASLQSRQEPVDRFGTSLPAIFELRLPLAGWISRETRGPAAGLSPVPPVPPPRFA